MTHQALLVKPYNSLTGFHLLNGEKKLQVVVSGVFFPSSLVHLNGLILQLILIRCLGIIKLAALYN